MRHWILSVSLLPLFFLLSCTNETQKFQQFTNIKKEIQQSFAPDLSIAVFDYQLKKENGHWILKGETTIPEARNALIRKLDSLFENKITDESVILPHPDLGDSNWAIVRLSVAHLRRQPKHASELVDQAIMGDVLRLLKQNGSWYLIQTHYGYIGWMTKYSFVRTTQPGIERWQKANKVMVNWPVERIYTIPSEHSTPVCDVVLNSLLKKVGQKGAWWLVETPDHRLGYIRKDRVIKPVGQRNPSEVLAADVVQTAYRLMGIPYLWGGNSAKASDCSGFTQTIFWHNGIQLPRDARQQALMGQEIKPKADFSNVKAGDLLFFGSGKRITHVGMSLGGYRFIHQDSDVHIDSFNPADQNFNAYRKKTLKLIKRILK